MVGHKASLLSAEFNSDGTLVLTAGYDRTARVWDAQTGECLVAHVGHDGAVNAARFLSRGFLLATAGSDRTARVRTTGNVETRSAACSPAASRAQRRRPRDAPAGRRSSRQGAHASPATTRRCATSSSAPARTADIRP